MKERDTWSAIEVDTDRQVLPGSDAINIHGFERPIIVTLRFAFEKNPR